MRECATQLRVPDRSWWLCRIRRGGIGVEVFGEAKVNRLESPAGKRGIKQKVDDRSNNITSLDYLLSRCWARKDVKGVVVVILNGGEKKIKNLVVGIKTFRFHNSMYCTD
jgi:hypothetical protein